MFSWICPRCGRENRPSDTDCPNCKAQDEAVRVETANRPVVQEPIAPQVSEPAQPRFPEPDPPARVEEPPRVVPPPAAFPEMRASAPPAVDPLRAPLQHAEPRRPAQPPVSAATRPGMPTWLMIPLFAFAFLGLGAALYFGYQRFGPGGKAGFTGGEVAANVPKPKVTNALQKYVEVVGMRLTQDAKKKPLAKFVVVNHGSTELNDLTANVTLWASTSRSEEDSVGTFTFKLNSLGANEAKEITTPLKTKLKIYELPDWQNVTADVQLTSP